MEFCLDIGRDRLFDIMNRHNLLIRPRVLRTRTTFSDRGMKVYRIYGKTSRLMT